MQILLRFRYFGILVPHCHMSVWYDVIIFSLQVGLPLNIELSFESLNLKCQSPIQPPINVQSLKMSILSRFSRFLDFAVGRVGDSVGDWKNAVGFNKRYQTNVVYHKLINRQFNKVYTVKCTVRCRFSMSHIIWLIHFKLKAIIWPHMNFSFLNSSSEGFSSSICRLGRDSI